MSIGVSRVPNPEKLNLQHAGAKLTEAKIVENTYFQNTNNKGLVSLLQTIFNFITGAKQMPQTADVFICSLKENQLTAIGIFYIDYHER